jgi:hypothetical protein
MDMTVTAIGAVVAGGLRDAGSRKLASPEAPTLEDASWVGAFGLERDRAGPFTEGGPSAMLGSMGRSWSGGSKGESPCGE